MKESKRNWIQAAAALLQNAHLSGFVTGEISTGAGKQVCVPGLNCYSCPGAVGACPIGSLQAVLSGGRRGFSYYVTGMILLFGVLFGRLICGFLCPFGFLQDLLYKNHTRKKTVPPRIDRPARYLKYAVLLFLVVALPLLVRGPYGVGEPWFCKYLCPAGTLEGGIPLILANPGLRAMVGFLFSWKMAILIAILVLSVLLYRPFCKYLCPLGAAYGLLNKCSFYRMSVDKSRCTRCGACERSCKMGVEVLKNINSTECIRCGACKNACPTGAIHSGFLKPEEKRQKAT
ncbi:MAG TPA: 4Fe-4S binding protein [Oscillospiraceae bacterium]|nr:4Fe-4S binding protein [Oscillospiraceae bacterium]